ncbi:MAG: hypothetical protein KAI59_01725 [Planctomycetes bacterium]|nr:hypothetical protein [Planctomycetota bacterium]MCK5472724.1 hypothetical protein [Planctomycetota bacterium]
MSQIDHDDEMLSETTQTQQENDSSKFVPVAESIRYRKRAQSAEKKNETLAEELQKAKSQLQEIAAQLSENQLEQKLTGKLIAAGTVDLETAVLIAKNKIQSENDVDDCVEQLKKEKKYLFANTSNNFTSTEKTAAAKDRLQSTQSVLERTAKKAAATGDRADLQQYLKLRRNFM